MTRRADRPAVPFWVPALVLGAAIVELLVVAVAPGGERADVVRLVAYPVLMVLLGPGTWWLAGRPPAAGAVSLVMLPFLIDATGNAFDLFGSVSWWDDVNHLTNWFLLCTGLGLILCRDVRPRAAVVLMVTGLGAVLAIGWELGEWYAFIRHQRDLGSAYEDSLSDEALGTLGALLAGVLVQTVLRRREHRDDSPLS